MPPLVDKLGDSRGAFIKIKPAIKINSFHWYVGIVIIANNKQVDFIARLMFTPNLMIKVIETFEFALLNGNYYVTSLNT